MSDDNRESAPVASDESELRKALKDLAEKEAEYRLTHDVEGDGSLRAGRAWDRLRRSGDRARELLSKESAPISSSDDLLEIYKRIHTRIQDYVDSEMACTAENNSGFNCEHCDLQEILDDACVQSLPSLVPPEMSDREIIDQAKSLYMELWPYTAFSGSGQYSERRNWWVKGFLRALRYGTAGLKLTDGHESKEGAE